MEDPYAVLGVSRDATDAEIRKAYKRLALSSHPDKVPAAERPAAEARFKVISEAYERLSDAASRAHFDQFGGQSPGAGPAPWQDYYDPGFGPEAFHEFFGFGAAPAPRRTPNAQFDIELSLEDIYTGKVLKLASTRQVICKQCAGQGGRSKARPKTCGKCEGTGRIEKLRPMGHGMMTANRVPCDACNGKGSFYRTKDLCRRCHGQTTLEESSVLEVYVPKGAPSGHKIVFKNKADEALGKETGDIIVQVEVHPHPLFERRGQDLYAHATISLGESLAGFSRVLLQHLDGRGLKLTVPRGKVTHPGEIFKIPRQGMPTNKAPGDLYLEISVEFPKELGQAALDSLAALLPSPSSKEWRGEVEDVGYKVVNQKDLPEYRAPTEEPEAGGCAQM